MHVVGRVNLVNLKKVLKTRYWSRGLTASKTVTEHKLNSVNYWNKVAEM